MNKQKGLAQKVLNSIEEKDYSKIILNYKEYTDYFFKLDKKEKDDDLLLKINYKYSNYMIEKHCNYNENGDDLNE